jgi:hypothetical protein
MGPAGDLVGLVDSRLSGTDGKFSKLSSARETESVCLELWKLNHMLSKALETDIYRYGAPFGNLERGSFNGELGKRTEVGSGKRAPLSGGALQGETGVNVPSLNILAEKYVKALETGIRPIEVSIRYVEWGLFNWDFKRQ